MARETLITTISLDPATTDYLKSMAKNYHLSVSKYIKALLVTVDQYKDRMKFNPVAGRYEIY